MKDTTPPVVRFVGGPTRSKVVDLEFPLEFNGTLYERITVRRLTVGDVEKFFEDHAALKDTDPAAAAKLHLPMLDCPQELIKHLDDSDGARLTETIENFLSVRFLDRASGFIRSNGDT